MSYVNYLSYVNYMSYVSYMIYVSYMSIIWITLNHFKSIEVTGIALNIIFLLLKILNKFLLIYKIGKLKLLKQKFRDKILKHLVLIVN